MERLQQSDGRSLFFMLGLWVGDAVLQVYKDEQANQEEDDRFAAVEEFAFHVVYAGQHTNSDGRVLHLLIFALCRFNNLAFHNSFTFVLQMALDLGFSPEKASLLISMIGITNTVGRIVSGWITDIPDVSPVLVTVLANFVGE